MKVFIFGQPKLLPIALIFLNEFLFYIDKMSRSKKTDYYELLDLKRDATEDQIKRAYKKLALKWHPDKNQHQKELAGEKFKEISEAYEILSDPQKRRIYDQRGFAGLEEDSSGPSGPGPGFSPFFSRMAGGPGVRVVRMSSGGPGMSENFFRSFSSAGPESIFEQFFKSNQGMFDPDESDFFQSSFRRSAFRANQAPIELEHQLAVDLELLYTGGKKRLKVTSPDKQFSEIFEVEIKPGWKDGTRVSFDARAGGKKYRVVFTIEGKPHPVFKRRDGDLICQLPYEETVLLKTLDGRTLKFSPTPSQKGETIVIPNEGMPIRKGGEQKGRGRLLVTLGGT
jgi:DnaJ-class molecular chaperone